MIKFVMKITAIVGTVVFYFMFGRGIFFLLFGSGILGNFSPLVSNFIRILAAPLIGALVVYAFTRKILRKSFEKAKINPDFPVFQKKYPTLEAETYKTIQWTVIIVMLFDLVVNLFLFFQTINISIN